MSSNAYYEAALRCAEWMVRNQVNDPGNDANTGRFLGYYRIGTDHKHLTHNWTTGVCVFGMLLAYRRTGDARYLEAAKLGGQSLKTLQVLDQRDPRTFGALKEATPHSRFCYPRDALTGAWALLWLFDETRNADLKYRARIFADWFVDVAMLRGWPAWDFRFEMFEEVGFDVDYTMGNFHGGSAGFFYDYARITGDTRHLERGLRFIADTTCERFLDETGRFKTAINRETGECLDDMDSDQHRKGYKRMHQFNDDFASIALLDAYAYYGDSIYLERAEAHAKWLMSEQQPDGSIGNPAVAVASATAPILWLDLHKLTGKQEYHDAAHRAGKNLLTLQIDKPEDPACHGAFLGYDDGVFDPNASRAMVNIRDAGYALLALLRLEGRVHGPYYSVFDAGGKISLRKP